VKGLLEKQVKAELAWVANAGQQSLGSIRTAKVNLLQTINDARKDFLKYRELPTGRTPEDWSDTLRDFVFRWFDKWFGDENFWKSPSDLL